LVSAHTDMSDMKYISSILLIFFINLNWSEGYSAERRQKRGLPIPPSVYQLFINDKAPDIDITPEQRGSCWNECIDTVIYKAMTGKEIGQHFFLRRARIIDDSGSSIENGPKKCWDLCISAHIKPFLRRSNGFSSKG